jgi:hypothetical protein
MSTCGWVVNALAWFGSGDLTLLEGPPYHTSSLFAQQWNISSNAMLNFGNLTPKPEQIMKLTKVNYPAEQ